MIELGRGKGPLIVAGAAARRERVGMDIILAVAVDAQVTGAGEAPIVNVAAVAALLIVGSLQLEVTHIVQGNDVRERVCGMASLTDGSELPLMHLGLGVARTSAVAVLGSRLKGHTGVAIRATHREVLTGELVVALAIVVEDVFAGLQVTVFALFAQPPAMVEKAFPDPEVAIKQINQLLAIVE